MRRGTSISEPSSDYGRSIVPGHHSTHFQQGHHSQCRVLRFARRVSEATDERVTLSPVERNEDLLARSDAGVGDQDAPRRIGRGVRCFPGKEIGLGCLPAHPRRKPEKLNFMRHRSAVYEAKRGWAWRQRRRSAEGVVSRLVVTWTSGGSLARDEPSSTTRAASENIAIRINQGVHIKPSLSAGTSWRRILGRKSRGR
jgi:hypothetical protein